MDSLIKATSAAVDKPGFNWQGLIIGFSVTNFVFESYLKLRQIRCVTANGDKVPKELEGKIDAKTASKSGQYSVSKLKFSIASDLYGLIQNIHIFKLNLLPKLWAASGSLLTSLLSKGLLPAAMSGTITHSLLFTAGFAIFTSLISLPVSYYQNFVLEEKYGFNKLTIKLWISDLIKGLAVGFVLGGPILAGFLKIIDYFGDQFMYYLSIFMFAVQIFLIVVYPKFIQPLFNTLTPLEEGKLKTEIEKLASKNKFPLDKLYVIDGSKRSSHSNAYFMGLPWGSKQIVLFDTLVESCTIPQVVAVLGHEIGHWALSHTTKLLAINEVHLFSIFTMFAAFINNSSLFESFGFTSEHPVLVGFMLFGDILEPMDAVVKFGMSLLSRTYEYQADEFSTKQGYGDDLKDSLILLNKENLSSVVVDKYYSAYTYDHPHITERIQAIDKVEAEIAAEKKD